MRSEVVLRRAVEMQAARVGWTIEDIEECARLWFSLDVPINAAQCYSAMRPVDLFRLYKNLCELEKFQTWRAVEYERRLKMKHEGGEPVVFGRIHK